MAGATLSNATHAHTVCAHMQTVNPSVLEQSCVLALSAPLRVRLQPCLLCNVSHLIGRREFSIVHPFVRGALLNSVEVSSVCVSQHAANHPKYRTLRLSYTLLYSWLVFWASLNYYKYHGKRYMCCLSNYCRPAGDIIKMLSVVFIF